MQAREQIIKLGKVLAQEQRLGYTDTVVPEGLLPFLERWQADCDGAMELPAVQQALSLLVDYDVQPVAVRRQRLDRALEGLRALFKNTEPRTQNPEPVGADQRIGPTPPAKTQTVLHK
nr:hypothetical protein [Chloroflexaceae bacterium]